MKQDQGRGIDHHHQQGDHKQQGNQSPEEQEQALVSRDGAFKMRGHMQLEYLPTAKDHRQNNGHQNNDKKQPHIDGCSQHQLPHILNKPGKIVGKTQLLPGMAAMGHRHKTCSEDQREEGEQQVDSR